MKWRKSAVTLLYLSIAIGCSKSNDTPPLLSVSQELDTSTDQPTIVPVAATPTPPMRQDTIFFNGNWETLKTMPVSPGTDTVPVPWSPFATRMFSNDILNDYKKSDGWEWVNSYFSYKINLQTLPAFVLYNKYRGIFRIYYYTSFGGASNVSAYKTLSATLYGIGDYAAKSPWLNFADQSIVDVNSSSSFASALYPQPIVDHAWYAIEFEFAFDPQFASRATYLNSSLYLNLFHEKLLSLNINGINSTNLPNIIKKAGLDFCSQNYPNPDFKDTLAMVIQGSNDLTNAAPYIGLTGNEDVANILSGQSQNYLINGLLNSTPIPSKVEWNASVALLAQCCVGIVSNFSLSTPGFDQTQVPGSNLHYNQVLGIFNLESRPIVRQTFSATSNQPYQYKVDIPTIRYLFNPVVSSIATFTNFKQEIVASPTKALLDAKEGSTTFTGGLIYSNKPIYIQGVRISFDVVPNDGSPTVKIVKTFKADVTIN